MKKNQALWNLVLIEHLQGSPGHREIKWDLRLQNLVINASLPFAFSAKAEVFECIEFLRYLVLLPQKAHITIAPPLSVNQPRKQGLFRCCSNLREAFPNFEASLEERCR